MSLAKTSHSDITNAQTTLKAKASKSFRCFDPRCPPHPLHSLELDWVFCSQLFQMVCFRLSLLSLSLSFSFSLSLSFSFSLSVSVSLSLSLFLSLSLSSLRFLSRSLSFPLSLTRSRSLSFHLFLSLSLLLAATLGLEPLKQRLSKQTLPPTRPFALHLVVCELIGHHFANIAEEHFLKIGTTFYQELFSPRLYSYSAINFCLNKI